MEIDRRYRKTECSEPRNRYAWRSFRQVIIRYRMQKMHEPARYPWSALDDSFKGPFLFLLRESLSWQLWIIWLCNTSSAEIETWINYRERRRWPSSEDLAVTSTGTPHCDLAFFSISRYGFPWLRRKVSRTVEAEPTVGAHKSSRGKRLET